MPRKPRIIAINYPYHITQRGNYKQIVFEDDQDKKIYLKWMQSYSEKYGLTILAYCLMSNHVHFIAVPSYEDTFSKLFNTLNMRYAQYFNKKTKQKGHLWQGRYFSCLLGNSHLLAAARYVERNPVRGKLVKKPWDWEWSSSMFNAKGENSKIKMGNLFHYIGIKPKEWSEYIDSKEDEEEVKEIVKHTLVGRPLGDNKFLKMIENKFEIKIPLLTRGRPKKGS